MGFRLVIRSIAITFFGAILCPVANADTTAVYQINESHGNYLQATLTHDIYRYSAQHQLQDVIVLDAEGNRLPLRIVPAQTQTQEKQSSIPVEFYPVTVGAAPDTWVSGNTQIRIDQGDVFINIDNKVPEQTGVQQTVDFYLLDISDLDLRIYGLTLEWQTSEASQYLDIELSGTRDLRSWTPVAQDTLVHLQKEGQTLTRNQISLSLAKNQYSYLRIKFLRGAENLVLTRILAQNKSQTTQTLPADIWQVNGNPAQVQTSVVPTSSNIKAPPVVAWEYQRSERTPVTKFQLALGETTYGDDLQVFSRATEKQPWRQIYRGIWFNARVGSDWQQSNAISIYPNSDIYWRVELNPSLPQGVKPGLLFEHPPQKLQFIANDTAPYKIAIDHRAGVQNANTTIFTQLIADKKLDWTEVSFEELKPDIAKFTTEARFNWQTALFWSLLLVAVAVLVSIAVRLYRQMNQA